MFGHLHEEFVVVADLFSGDPVIAESFNHGLAIRENVGVPIPLVPV
jgi:hypothetical protein